MLTTVCVCLPFLATHGNTVSFLLTALCACGFFIVKNKQKSKGPDEEIPQLVAVRAKSNTLPTAYRFFGYIHDGFATK